jgi:nitroimidazol reductase NimA-like FMN-containing flavoprotein (pyridoxamine 5'-phosphate oxidase superfamily)
MDELLKQKILGILDTHRIMTVATMRPDGWPQATTVGYVHEGLTLYFLCGSEGQKAANLARDDRISLTVDDDSEQLMEITGLSMAAHATRVTDMAKAQELLLKLIQQYEGDSSYTGPMPDVAELAIYRIEPIVISVLDYTKGFGHTDLVSVQE